MGKPFQSEIRESTIRELLQKVKQQKYGNYLRKVRLNRVRAFTNESVDFEFPVTALIGTNGSGKSTILGAAAIAYKSVRPAQFFPKSSVGDTSMSNWSIAYEIIDKAKNTSQTIQRSARFKNAKWARDELLERSVLHFGIQRTVPAGERREFKRFATNNYKFTGTQNTLDDNIRSQVEKILGKDVSAFTSADVTNAHTLYVGGDGKVSYSEFHFGAGESSVIRMVSSIEAAPENSLVLVEEIENGLHPVAVRRMVEYLIDVAERRSIQSIFTTHSEDAITPLPSEAIWSASDGKARQGRISIEALRALTGKIDERVAIFAEDDFARVWTIGLIRILLPDLAEEVGVYALSGDSRAYSVHQSHRINPATANIRSLCVLDGDSAKDEDLEADVIKLPGRVPESVVFDYVHGSIDSLAMKLAIALHLPPEKEEQVKKVVNEVSLSNRDPHLLFNQIGQGLGYIATSIVESAFVSLWVAGNPDEANRIADFVRDRARKEA
jgi:AAA15 family ATPase/GTPase